jgi:hypothetical protein
MCRSWWTAEIIASVGADQRRIGPTVLEAQVFDIALLVCTVVEWYGIGLIVRRVLTARRND